MVASDEQQVSEAAADVGAAEHAATVEGLAQVAKSVAYYLGAPSLPSAARKRVEAALAHLDAALLDCEKLPRARG